MILLIDNYDSFSYNLVQMMGVFCPDIQVVRNDAVTIADIEALAPERIVLSPGPGYPKDAGLCMDVVRELGGKVPILGVCLGHQAICEALGGEIVLAGRLMHGKKSPITLTGSSPLFEGLPLTISGARYHSLVAKPDSLPDCLEITGRGPEGEIMAVQHKEKPIYGLQFHPESILTQRGNLILKNFIGGYRV